MATPRRTSRLGNQNTRTGLADRLNRANENAEREGLVTTRGTDELLARAREAGAEEDGPDHSTLSDIHSLLRDV